MNVCPIYSFHAWLWFFLKQSYQSPYLICQLPTAVFHGAVLFTTKALSVQVDQSVVCQTPHPASSSTYLYSSANGKQDKTPMCKVAELARYNRVSFVKKMFFQQLLVYRLAEINRFAENIKRTELFYERFKEWILFLSFIPLLEERNAGQCQI